MSPSRQMVRLYIAISHCKGYVTAESLIKKVGASSTMIRRTLTAWHGQGMVDRKQVNFEYLWRWHPAKHARPHVEKLEAAAGQIAGIGRSTAGNPAAQALRALARLLTSAAKSLDQNP